MDNAGYINIARQTGLLRELDVIANNIANSGTVGYKRESSVFTEYVNSLKNQSSLDALESSVSMGRLGAHVSHFESGELRRTGGTYDIAIDGEGFFLVGTQQGDRLSRAGNFQTDNNGILVNFAGDPVLDNAGGQIQIPQNINRLVIGPDGTLSADGLELGRIGIVTAPVETLVRSGDNLWATTDGFEPVIAPRVLQGFLEGSNVEPVVEIARMIEVQRYYDAGQKIMDMEDERIKSVVTSIRQMV